MGHTTEDRQWVDVEIEDDNYPFSVSLFRKVMISNVIYEIWIKSLPKRGEKRSKAAGVERDVNGGGGGGGQAPSLLSREEERQCATEGLYTTTPTQHSGSSMISTSVWVAWARTSRLASICLCHWSHWGESWSVGREGDIWAQGAGYCSVCTKRLGTGVEVGCKGEMVSCVVYGVVVTMVGYSSHRCVSDYLGGGGWTQGMLVRGGEKDIWRMRIGRVLVKVEGCYGRRGIQRVLIGGFAIEERVLVGWMG
ncbi:hypothetical protein Tco_1023776 [Tanacetum coccineum]